MKRFFVIGHGPAESAVQGFFEQHGAEPTESAKSYAAKKDVVNFNSPDDWAVEVELDQEQEDTLDAITRHDPAVLQIVDAERAGEQDNEDY